MHIPLSQVRLAVVGLGYVGLPLAIAFAQKKQFPVVGFDINADKISALQNGIDPTLEVGDSVIKATDIVFTASPDVLKQCNVIIVAVPTPITPDRKPDLRMVESASTLVGKYIQSGTIVIFESTVYPGVTDDICAPLIAAASGLRRGSDFVMGYSPERINPGDKEHTLDRVVKVVSADDPESLATISALYQVVCDAGVHQAPTIKTAEAAKVIENIQRDLNISLMNELALIFQMMGIDTRAVLQAAGTKWNFHKYNPGLVGGHCIGVDPYYLTHRAQELGYIPQIILAGRNLNDAMPQVVAQQVVDALPNPRDAKILVLGLTFKENVADFRNSKSFDVIAALRHAGVTVLAHDPFGSTMSAHEEVSEKIVSLDEVADVDGIMYLVAHDALRAVSLETLKQKCRGQHPILFDLKRVYSRAAAEDAGFIYLCL